MGSESSDFWKIVWYILYTIFINNPTLKKNENYFLSTDLNLDEKIKVIIT